MLPRDYLESAKIVKKSSVIMIPVCTPPKELDLRIFYMLFPKTLLKDLQVSKSIAL